MSSAPARSRLTFPLVALLLAAIAVPPALSAQTSGFDAVTPAMQAFVDKGEGAGVVTLLARPEPGGEATAAVSAPGTTVIASARASA